MFLLSKMPRESLIYKYTIARFEVKNGKMSADNRTSSAFDNAYNNYTRTARVFIGAKKKAVDEVTRGISSYKQIIYEYGIIIFAILVYLILRAGHFAGEIRNIRIFGNRGILIFLFLLSVYQRPNVINIPFLIVLYGGLANHAIGQRKYERNLNESIIIR